MHTQFLRSGHENPDGSDVARQAWRTGHKTGFWLEEFAAPYYVFLDAGADVTLASPLGGQPPEDPKSDAPDMQTDATRRFRADAAASDALAHTLRLSAISAKDFDAIFYPGGHGPLWDLAEDKASRSRSSRPCWRQASRSPRSVMRPASCVTRRTPQGRSLVEGKKVTGFTNSEEQAVGLTEIVPFLVEDMLRANGGLYSKSADWQPYVVVDGRLITGQNPASSELAAKSLLDVLRAGAPAKP